MFGRIEIFDFVQYVKQYVGVPANTDLHIIMECHGYVGAKSKLFSYTGVSYNADEIFRKAHAGQKGSAAVKTKAGANAVSKAGAGVGRNAQLGFDFQKACIKYFFPYSPVLNQQRQNMKNANAQKVISSIEKKLKNCKLIMPTKLTNKCVQEICTQLNFKVNKKVTNDDERSAFGLILPQLIKNIK